MLEIAKSVEQKDAEAEVASFRKDLGPFVVAAETTRMTMLFTDATEPDNRIIFANDSFLSLTGYNREEVLGKGLNFLMANGSDAEALSKIKTEFEGSSSSGTEVLYRRKDGSVFWAALFVSPVRDAARLGRSMPFMMWERSRRLTLGREPIYMSAAGKTAVNGGILR